MVLSASGLSVGYRTGSGAALAVTDIDLDLRRGEFTALIGESGSGKTTVARTMLGLLPHGGYVAEGSVEFRLANGSTVDLLAATSQQVREVRWTRVAYVPQAASGSFNPLLTIEEHFEETVNAHGFAWKESRGRAVELLQMVRLEPNRVLPCYPHQLSGGSAQRAFIALSLILNPDVVVLDEPTTGLDVITQRSVVETLKELRGRLSSAFLVVTHDLHLAVELGAQVVTMYAGRIVENWVPSQPPQHPYTKALLAAIPDVRDPQALPKGIPGRPATLGQVAEGCGFAARCSYAMEACHRGDHPQLESKQHGLVACHLYARSGDE